jgi:hypothetical protein
MRVARKFKQLTKLTYPHGTENMLVNHLPDGYKEDGFGNYYLKIGESSTMFTCHLDTACSKQEKIKHVEEGNFIKTDGTTILGADDKAGMVVLLYMIRNKIPGLYYFFVGEESGCIGSGKLSRNWLDMDFSKYITKVISFDRRGTNSIITHQLYGRGCSDEFATDLANRLNSTNYGMKFRLDDTGIYTDSAKFIQLVPECTNISVGYYSEHTPSERQDIDFLRRLCRSVCEVNWDDLVILGNGFDSDIDIDLDDEDDIDYSDIDNYDWVESKEWCENNYSYFSFQGKNIRMYISKDHVDTERTIILKWLLNSNIYPGLKKSLNMNVEWNGDSLFVDSDYIGDRCHLSDFIPDLKSVPVSKLKERLD